MAFSFSQIKTSLEATVSVANAANARALSTSNLLFGDSDSNASPFKSLRVNDSIIPADTNTTIGSSNNHFKTAWIDELHLSTNTLYIGDTPVLGTDQDTIEIKADPDQSINIKTAGLGVTNLTSAKGVNVATSGINSVIDITASGSGGQVTLGALSQVMINAPTATVTSNLIVQGNLTVNGTEFTVNTQTVEVQDNIMVLNAGQTGTGVSSGTAGLTIDRGDALNYQFLFDETDDKFKVGPQGSLLPIATTTDLQTKLSTASNLSDLTNVAQARSNLGLENVSVTAMDASNITSGTLAVARGGTGTTTSTGSGSVVLANAPTFTSNLFVGTDVDIKADTKVFSRVGKLDILSDVSVSSAGRLMIGAGLDNASHEAVWISALRNDAESNMPANHNVLTGHSNVSVPVHFRGKGVNLYSWENDTVINGPGAVVVGGTNIDPSSNAKLSVQGGITATGGLAIGGPSAYNDAYGDLRRQLSITSADGDIVVANLNNNSYMDLAPAFYASNNPMDFMGRFIANTTGVSLVGRYKDLTINNTASNIVLVTQKDIVADSRYFGIGTSAPTEALDVAGNINATGKVVANGLSIDGYTMAETDAQDNSAYASSNHIVSPWIYSSAIQSLVQGGAGPCMITVGDCGGTLSNLLGNPTTAVNTINLITAGSSRMVVGNNGVGIGTSAPTEALDVVGNVTASGTVSVNNAATYTDALLDNWKALAVGGMTETNRLNVAHDMNSPTSARFYVYPDANNVWLCALKSDTSGYTNGNNSQILGGSAWSAYMLLRGKGINLYSHESNIQLNGSGSFQVQVGTPSNIDAAAKLSVNGSIVTNGKVSAASLDITGAIKCDGSIQTNAFLDMASSFANQSDYGTRILQDDATGRLKISHRGHVCFERIGGNVGIRTASPAYPLDVVGDINSSTNVRASGVVLTSDDRVKSDETFIADATATLNKLRPQNYSKWSTLNYAGDSNATSYTESGLIAQEIFYDAPELRHLVTVPVDADSNAVYSSNVTSSSDPSVDPDYSAWGSNLASVNYNGLIPYLIKALQEKDGEIKVLEARMSAAGF